MNHYESAEHHQASADNMAKTALAASTSHDDPMAAIGPLLGALVDLLAAQSHATLALVDAINAGAPFRHQCRACRNGRHASCTDPLECECCSATSQLGRP